MGRNTETKYMIVRTIRGDDTSPLIIEAVEAMQCAYPSNGFWWIGRSKTCHEDKLFDSWQEAHKVMADGKRRKPHSATRPTKNPKKRVERIDERQFTKQAQKILKRKSR